MAPIVASTEVARPAEEAFAYVIDPSTMSEWQQGVVRGHLDTPATGAGSRCTTIRRIGGREREVITEITEYDPPRRWADRAPAARSGRSSRSPWNPSPAAHDRGGLHRSRDRKAARPPHRPSSSRQRDAGEHEAAQAAT
jgi:hypothetical protein